MNNYLLTEEILFDCKPDAVPYNYRISYKMSQIALIIGMCCSGRSGCPLLKLYVISYALNSRINMSQLEEYIDGKRQSVMVRLDPAVNRAVKYALADKVIMQLKNGSYKLTDKGKKLVSLIKQNDDLMMKEKSYLSQVGTKLSTDMIEKLMAIWGYTNVKNK